MTRRMSLSVLLVGALLVLAFAALRDREAARPMNVDFDPSSTSDMSGGSDEVDATTIVVEEDRPTERADDSRPPARSGIETFVELRGIPRVAVVESDLTEFASESRDPAWSTVLEARLQSALAQTTATLAGSYVECRTSRCLVALVRPAGSYDQKQPVGLPNGALTREVAEIGRGLDLLGVGASQLLARDGALVHWQTLHRRCGPEWKCLEREVAAQ